MAPVAWPQKSPARSSGESAASASVCGASAGAFRRKTPDQRQRFPK